jgi:(heptosyl)LPS beta-1,4-glucosyltransferase
MISVVINTLNDEENIGRAIKSVKWADEIVVCDMNSSDNTADIAKKLGAKIVNQPQKDYVELVRNFNISQASNEWVLILDPDEEISDTLAEMIIEMIKKPIVSDFIEIPRKNIIFGKWIKNSLWWPDYNIRLFKKGSVTWSEEIHRPPTTKGDGLKLLAEEKNAIIHHHYDNVSQFIQRLDRYTNIQAKELLENGYIFDWKDLIHKPVGEFLSRYFANRGFEDGLHGLVLSLLQSFSFLILYIKVWEKNDFKEEKINLVDIKDESEKVKKEFNYWIKYSNLSKSHLKRFFQKVSNKIL